jgi:RHS repeat-associated protein
LDNSGNEIAGTRQKYYPFGETRGTATAPTDRQFTGQRRESTSLGSLYDYGARFYSPALGRFLSADTIVPEPGNPQSLNRYSYTYNNPVKYTDPSGRDVDCGLAESGCKRLVKKKFTPPLPIPPVITYIYNEMMTNVRGDVARLITKLNAQCFACMWSDTPLWWPGVAKALSDAYASDAAAKADATAIFGWMVRTNGDWDHKKQIRDMEQAAGRDPDYQQVGEWAYRWDTWSNIHFGYIGAATGFPINSLLDGAGTEQWWTDTILGRPTTEAPGVSGERRFDEPWDQAAIQIGIDLWNTYGLAVKPEHLIHAIQNTPGLLKRPAQGGQP